MSRGERVLATARAAIGSWFRLHGRDPASGLDCIGLVAHAVNGAGQRVSPATGYALRSGDVARSIAAIEAAGLIGGADGPGDVLLAVAGRGQVHFGIATDAGEACGAVHADAGLRRVVERPGPLPWRIVGRWRLAEEE